MHLVREMKKYGQVKVANAMSALGWSWKHARPTNIERMVQGLPRCHLENILRALQKDGV